MEDRIKELFNSYVMDIHNQGNQYFPVVVDRSALTYFEDPQHREYIYVSTIDATDAIKIREYLHEIWRRTCAPELMPAADKIAEIAMLLKNEQQEQNKELSPFIYVMY